MRGVLIVVLTAIFLGGCTAKYRVESLDAPKIHPDNAATFYVSLPRDGVYGTRNYPQSGAMTAQAVVSALSRHVQKVEPTQTVEGTDQELATAKLHGLHYLFETTILNWEDRATEWSGIPDKLSLKFSVYEVQTGRVNVGLGSGPLCRG